MANSNKGISMTPNRAVQLADIRLKNALEQVAKECPAWKVWQKTPVSEDRLKECAECRYAKYKKKHTNRGHACTRFGILYILEMILDDTTVVNNLFKDYDEEP